MYVPLIWRSVRAQFGWTGGNLSYFTDPSGGKSGETAERSSKFSRVEGSSCATLQQGSSMINAFNSARFKLDMQSCCGLHARFLFYHCDSFLPPKSAAASSVFRTIGDETLADCLLGFNSCLKVCRVVPAEC